MGDAAMASDDRLALARSLVANLESGKDDDAATQIAELAGFRDSILFQEIGRLTRELHDSINGFVMDSNLANIAETDMPDAAERLSYVIHMTEDAANTTLSAVENAMPIAEQLHSESHRLSEQWRQFNERKLTVEDFRELSAELGTFLESAEGNSKELNDKLSEVLMAQGYQDLTGQIIRKVIDLVHDVEDKLVELVRISGTKEQSDKTKAADDKAVDHSIEAMGPAVPGVDKVDAVQGQDEVDDLLSSLGF